MPKTAFNEILAFTKKFGAGFFGGYGFILEKCSGKSTIFIHVYVCFVGMDLLECESVRRYRPGGIRGGRSGIASYSYGTSIRHNPTIMAPVITFITEASRRSGMIIFSKVLADRATVWEALRAKEFACAEAPDDLIRFSSEAKPVIMWNITRECNLSCKHCYMDARSKHPDEWTLEEGIRFIDEMASFGAPILIVTGGEPLISENFFPFAFHAKEKGVRMVISTNGTLITPEVATLLAEADIRYVGVSVDAANAEMHDSFRGVKGSFDRAMEGIKNAQEAGLKTGLRITIHKENWQEVPKLLDICVEMGIPRFCLYHLVPTGRGKGIMELDVTKEQRTQVLKHLYDRAIELRDKEIEILTTDSPMDGVYILERLKQEDPERFDKVRELLTISGGCSIGNKVANVDYLGNVNPCHFTPQMTVGNVKESSFSEIWNECPGTQLLEIRERRMALAGTCGRCDYMDVCGGCRQKAYFYGDDFYGGDPTCIYDPDKKQLEYELF